MHEGGETGKRNISLAILLVWKLNGFWEFKLDAIFFSTVRECDVLDFPVERGDSVKIFLHNLVLAKLFVFVIHLSHLFIFSLLSLLQLCVCENRNDTADFVLLCDSVSVIQDRINEISLSHRCFCRY